MIPTRVYCITLPEYPAKKEAAQKHFGENNIDVTFFNGIHAEKFGLKTIFPYEVDVPGSNYNMGPKPTGIWLSHYMLWGALNLLWDDAFLVLEDDAKFADGWHGRYMKALADVPKDFDMLYVGSCCCEGKPSDNIAGEVFEVKYPLCTHAMLIAKKALPVLLQTQRKCYAPIDISMVFHSHPQMKIYTVLPRIVEQFNTFIAP